MRKIYIVLLVFISSFAVNEVKAQDYQSAIGAKIGYGFIGTYKKFLGEAPALDVYVGFGFYNGFIAGANYQHHMDISGVDRLRWFIGGGVSVLTFAPTRFLGQRLNNGYIDFGINFNIGLDYSFDNIPLNLSVEYSPTFIIASTYDNAYGLSYNRFRGGYAGASARYILQY